MDCKVNRALKARTLNSDGPFGRIYSKWVRRAPIMMMVASGLGQRGWRWFRVDKWRSDRFARISDNIFTNVRCIGGRGRTWAADINNTCACVFNRRKKKRKRFNEFAQLIFQQHKRNMTCIQTAGKDTITDDLGCCFVYSGMVGCFSVHDFNKKINK